MRLKLIFALTTVLFSGAVIFSTVDAQPAAGSTTWPLSLITQPCVSIGVDGPNGGPARVVCLGVTGRTATVNVPTPWLSDRAPELSLVIIPTFFNLEWDPGSLGALDSAPLTISNPIGDPTDRLVNVRVQLRLRPSPFPVPASETQLTTDNVRIETPASVYLVDPDDDTREYYNLACNPSSEPGAEANALLTVEDRYGGYATGEPNDNPCQRIRGLLNEPSISFPSAGINGANNVARYPDWTAIGTPQFLSFTPYASIYGSGTDRGSPAFQMRTTTRFIVEARVVWDEHQHKREEVTTDCQWSYWDNYDFVDWSRWPGPIYCRWNVEVTWPVFCRPFAKAPKEGQPDLRCPYGHPDNWWISYAPALEAEAIRRPDGTYSTSYDFVSVQSQALLTAP